MKKENRKNRLRVESPRVKLLIVLAIIGVTMAAVFYWSYNNYLNVTNSLNEIALPNTKTSVINEVFQEIIEADAIVTQATNPSDMITFFMILRF